MTWQSDQDTGGSDYANYARYLNGDAVPGDVVLVSDTLAKFRAAAPEGIRADVAAYLERTGERSNAMIDYAGFIQQAADLEDQITV